MIGILVLKSGQEVLAELELVSPFYTIKKPQLIMVTQQGIMMVPWLMYTKCYTDGITISETDVLAHVEPNDEMRNKYIEITTGVKVVQTQTPPFGGLKLTE